MGTLCRHLLSSILFVLLTSCASTPIIIPNGAIDESALPNQHLIKGLPYFPQENDHCGPAALATMLGARNIGVSVEHLVKKIYIPAKKGSLTTEMIAQARQAGLLVYPLAQSIEHLLQEVSTENPVMVLQNLGLKWAPQWHFSVVIGYDLERQVAILRSGQHIAYETPLTLFLKTWARADHWAVVIMEPHEPPMTVEASPFLQAAHELEMVGKTQAALAAYRTATIRWPHKAIAFFGAGNTAFALQQFAQASNFYRAYLRLEPTEAAGWNNLAYTLLKRQCADQALQAAQCAVQLAPQETAYQYSLAEITEGIQKISNLSYCKAIDCPNEKKSEPLILNE